MNKIIFVCSNLHSGSEHFVKSLLSGSRIQKINGSYDNVGILFSKISIKEYGKNPIYYLDHLIYNYQFSNKVLLDHCYFIFLIGDPKVCLTNMINENCTEIQACNYYTLRVRKLYEMIKKSKNKIVLFNEDLVNQNLYKNIHEKLGIKDRIKPKFKNLERKEVIIDKNIITEAEDFYEKYRYIIKENHQFI